MYDVVFIANNVHGIGGVVRHVITNSNYLHINGCRVTILSVTRSTDVPRMSLDEGVHLVSLAEFRKGKKKSLLQKILGRFRSRLINSDEDLYSCFSLYTDIRLIIFLLKQRNSVIICTISSFFFLARFLRWRGCSVIPQEHKGYVFHSKALQNQIRTTYKDARVIHCVNNVDQEIYRELFPQIDVRWISNSIVIPEKISSQNSKIIIAAGRLSEQKNFPALLRALSLTKAIEASGWKLHIYGQGKDRSELCTLIQTLGLSGKVRIFPPVDTIMQCYAQSAIYVSSSSWESFGLTTLEAMACALPVVATRTDGSCLLVQDGVTGYLVERGDDMGMAHAIDKLAADTELRSTMGQAGRVRACNFSVETVGEQWLTMLTDISQPHR